jgi:hypothetical protein
MCSPDAAFGVPAPVAGLTNIMADSVAGLRLSPDSLTGYFEADCRLGVYESALYTAVRSSPLDPFVNVTRMQGTGLDGVGNWFEPTVTGDGLLLVFAWASYRSDPTQLSEARRATKGDPFGDVRLMTEVNDPDGGTDENPFVLEGNEALYFDSTRVPAYSFDLYKAVWNRQSFSSPMPVRELNTLFREIAPVVTPDELTIYFATDQQDGVDGHPQGEWDIWMSTRPSAGAHFSLPWHVRELDSPRDAGGQWNAPTFVTRDGCTLYFSSNRSGVLLPYFATRGR